MGARRFADVALPLSVDQAFTYRVPEALESRIAVGMRALVPVRNRMETGYVTGLHDSTELDTLRDVIDLPDPGPVFSEEMLTLCEWVSQYYCCSLGEALQCAVPAGIAIRSEKRYMVNLDRLDQGRYTKRQQEIVAELHRSGPQTEKQLAKLVGRAELSSALQSLGTRGTLAVETIATDPAISTRTETWTVVDEEQVLEPEAQAALQRRAPKQAALYLGLLHGDPEQLASDLYEKHHVNRAALRGLADKKLVRLEEREFYRMPPLGMDPNADQKFTLNEEQEQAFKSVIQAIDAGTFSTFLLKGITGSGKTEVYLQIIEYVLEQGRDAVMLVPEISLTPQTVGRFVARFGTDIAVLHSGLAAGERYDEWRRAQRGEVRIVVGARSAVFAPLPDVGVVIVDEEHDTSYKQADVPRYHARDVAVMRASMNNAICVLGSATPSIESYFNSERGKSQRLELNQRATNALLPEVRVVDMRIEAKEVGGEAPLSRMLESEIHQRVVAKEQVILLLNRRGHSPFVLCASCGWIARCEDCHVSLTYHARGSHLSCHYCNQRHSVPQICGECEGKKLTFLGLGTQKVEDLIQRSFPNARVERMDRDTTSGKSGHARILGRFAKGEIDILIGTQMIAKGHDYPGVTLVGVINADTGLSFPDFRAAETGFQLLTQVAGRAGRGDKPGTVIIQTFRPRHYAVEAAAQHDYAAFYAREIEERKSAQYPPFRRLVNFAIEAEDSLDAQKAIARLHRVVIEQIEALDFHGIQILGPAPATVHRVKRRYRWNLGAFSKSSKRLNALARAVRITFDPQTNSKTHLKIDLDPYGMF